MTEKRKSFLMNSPFKFLLSLFMAFIMFLHFPLAADAALTATAFTPLFPGTRSYIIPSDHNPNSELVGRFYAFSSSVNQLVSFSCPASNAHGYVSGVVSVYAVFNFSVTADSKMSLDKCNVSLSSFFAPDGCSPAVSVVSHTNTQCVLEIVFTLDEVRMPSTNVLYASLEFDVSAVGIRNQEGTMYGAFCILDTSFQKTGLDIGYAYSSLRDFDPDFKFIEDNLSAINSALNNTRNDMNTHLNAVRTNQNTINSSINTQGKNITDKIQAQITNDNANTTAINNKIQAQINNDNSNTTKTINALNANSKSEVDAANKNSQNEINTANKNADDIMHSFDSGSQDDKNSQFDTSQKELQETEDNLFGSASGYFSGLDFSLFDIAKFTSVVSSLSFVSGLMQSLYTKMGDFGLIVTVGMVIMIASKVIGVYRFSTGDHGKGG